MKELSPYLLSAKFSKQIFVAIVNYTILEMLSNNIQFNAAFQSMSKGINLEPSCIVVPSAFKMVRVCCLLCVKLSFQFLRYSKLLGLGISLRKVFLRT